MMLTHPDAPDLNLGSWWAAVSGESVVTSEVMFGLFSLLLAISNQAFSGESRYRHAKQALERFSPDSPWRVFFSQPEMFDDNLTATAQTVEIGDTEEEPVPFDLESISAVLADEERGARYFPGYRARPEQITLMRSFFENLAGGGTLLIEGGTGVGKSLAYLAAAIPFAMARSEGRRGGTDCDLDPHEASSGSAARERHRGCGAYAGLSATQSPFHQGSGQLSVRASLAGYARGGFGSGPLGRGQDESLGPAFLCSNPTRGRGRILAGPSFSA